MWKPGQSGNPKGGTKAQAGMSARLARAIADATDDGRELWEAVLDVLRKADATSPQWARVKLEAAAMLLDRAAGKPQAMLEITRVDETGPTIDDVIASLSPEQIALLESLGEKNEDDAPSAATH